jgi:hypothetical protein
MGAREQSRDTAKMNASDNRTCLIEHLRAENRHDMTAVLATLHPECVFVDMPLGLRLHGRAGARHHYDIWWSAFGATVDDGRTDWIDDDFLVGEAAFVGRHDGPFVGIEPTGRAIRVPFVVFVEFRDGLLAAERFLYDLNGLLRQIGRPAFEPVAA